MYKLSERSRGRLQGVHPYMVRVFECAITNAPFDFGIPSYGGLRTSNDQQQLYAIGRTIDVGSRKPVTYVDGINKKSNHQIKADGWGHAIDTYLYINGKASWDGNKFEILAEHILKWGNVVSAENEEWKNFYISWGGSWTRFKDYPHFEMKSL